MTGTGTKDRPEHLPDDHSSIVEVDRKGTATIRDDLAKTPAGTDEDPDAMDPSPARRKDRARDTPTGEAGPNDDTYD